MPVKHPLKFYAHAMQEKALLSKPVALAGLPEIEIENLTYDSRKVTPHTLFICKGRNFRPAYLQEAKKSGAVAYVSEVPYPEVDLPALLTSDIRAATILLGQTYYAHVDRHFTTVGITGTKGKSTTAYYLRAICDAWQRAQNRPPVAFISSISTFDGTKEEKSHLTTPEPLDLYAHFQNAYDAGIENLIMEVSSQALKYGRVEGIEFAIGCFLNIGMDHISEIEHPNFADYFASKLKIFQSCRAACVNSHSEHLAEILAAAQKAGITPRTFGYQNDDDVQISEVNPTEEGSRFHISGSFYNGDFTLAMPGVFNVENAAAAITMAGMLGIPEEYVRRGLESAHVTGRMRIYKSADKNVVVLVDYAHNRMSFEAVFACAHAEYPEYAPVAVFGSAGGKAYSRRKDLGETAGEHASSVILTEDDPYTEPVIDICQEIAQYVQCPHEIVEDRQLAIKKAILGEYGCERVPARRIVLLLGKGEDTEMKRQNGWEKAPSDAELAQKYLAALPDCI